MKKLIVSFILLVNVTNASAFGMTSAERVNTRLLFDALHEVTLAYQQIAVAVGETTTGGGGNRSALNTLACGAMQNAFINGKWGVNYIIGVNPEGTANSAAREAMPRSQWVSDGNARINSTITNLGDGSNAADAAAAVAGQSATYYTAVANTKTHINNAKTDYQTFNQSLTYLLARQSAYGDNVFGPHGIKSFSTFLLQSDEFTRGFLENWLGFWCTVYTANGGGETELPTSTNIPLQDFLDAIAQVSDNIDRTTFIFVSQAPTLVECTLSPLQTVINGFQNIYLNNPGHFNLAQANNISRIGTHMEIMRVPLASRPNTKHAWRMLFRSMIETWRFQGGATWIAQQFPAQLNTTGLAQQFGDGVTTNYVLDYYVSDPHEMVVSSGEILPRADLVYGTDWTMTGVPGIPTLVFSAPPTSGDPIWPVMGQNLNAKRRAPNQYNDIKNGVGVLCP